ncbi:TIGR02611 family protein [Pseudonocardia eucalypti]|uniref:TIGR02611 family protein n=2 Tax=Pseudonocardia eucalypti TaxID=648755 RepID=A0ABP9QTQ1_9PSEU
MFYRVGIAVVGGLVLLAGILMIPYPGPGWLVVFAGLAILATEFAWAHRLLGHARARYDAWTDWLARQHWSVKLLVLAGTGAIVLVTLWLLGTVGWVAGWFGIRWTWLQSPFG